jgi:hypothetical protein
MSRLASLLPKEHKPGFGDADRVKTQEEEAAEAAIPAPDRLDIIEAKFERSLCGKEDGSANETPPFPAAAETNFIGAVLADYREHVQRVEKPALSQLKKHVLSHPDRVNLLDATIVRRLNAIGSPAAGLTGMDQVDSLKPLHTEISPDLFTGSTVQDANVFLGAVVCRGKDWEYVLK